MKWSAGFIILLSMSLNLFLADLIPGFLVPELKKEKYQLTDHKLKYKLRIYLSAVLYDVWLAIAYFWYNSLSEDFGPRLEFFVYSMLFYMPVHFLIESFEGFMSLGIILLQNGFIYLNGSWWALAVFPVVCGLHLMILYGIIDQGFSWKLNQRGLKLTEGFFEWLDNNNLLLDKDLRYFYEISEKNWHPNYKDNLDWADMKNNTDEKIIDSLNNKLSKKSYYSWKRKIFNKSNISLCKSLEKKSWIDYDKKKLYDYKLLQLRQDFLTLPNVNKKGKEKCNIMLINTRLARPLIRINAPRLGNSLNQFFRQQGKPNCFLDDPSNLIPVNVFILKYRMWFKLDTRINVNNGLFIYFSNEDRFLFLTCFLTKKEIVWSKKYYKPCVYSKILKLTSTNIEYSAHTFQNLFVQKESTESLDNKTVADRSLKFPLRYKAIDVIENKSLLAIFFYETFFASMYLDYSKNKFSEKIVSYKLNSYSKNIEKVRIASENCILLQAKSITHDFSEVISQISVNSC